MRYKFCKFCENRARSTPLWGVYFPHIGQIWVKISVFVVLHPCRCTDGVEIWHGGGGPKSPPPCQISPPSVQRVAIRGEKPQNRPLRLWVNKILAACAARNAAGKNQKKGTTDDTNIDIQAMLVWLIVPFSDLCGFWSVAVTSVYKLQFFYIYLGISVTVYLTSETTAAAKPWGR